MSPQRLHTLLGAIFTTLGLVAMVAIGIWANPG
jgi:hypothetical protein